MVRNLFASPVSRGSEPPSTSGTPNTLPPPPHNPFQAPSPGTRGLPGFTGYHHPGHRSSGYVPSGSNGPSSGSRSSSGFLRGGKKRSHSQSSVNDLDITSLTRSSQGSLNMLQAMQSSRSGVSSTGGSYGHLSAGKRAFAHKDMSLLVWGSSKSSRDMYPTYTRITKE